MTLIHDTRYLFMRSLKKLIRNPILLFFSLFQPIIFLLLFTQLFSKFASIPDFPAESYLAFATPGILLQNAFSSALQSGTSIVDDLDSGYLHKMLVTPVSRSAILLGRLTSDAFRVTIQSLIILGLAYLLGTSVVTGIGGLLLILATIAFFGLAWSGISLAIGLRTKNSESVFGIGAFLTFPLLFMSTALTPLSFMPEWIQNVSNFNPISYTVNAVRALMLNGYEWNTIIAAYAVIGLIAVLTLGATLYLFRKVIN
ncbi:MAG: ABC transporter permease [Nitrososphaerales archaeon]|nr:ABC transporter permease [Nitrososphaerales archaeon]HJN58195.1 ABC transporter permease [Nitrososphaerales archaeon]